MTEVTGAKDVPVIEPGVVDERVRRPVQRLTEELRRLLGFVGDSMDQAVTWRQLHAAGLVELSSVARVGRPPGSISIPTSSGGGTGTGGGAGEAYEPDFTPPPDVTGLTAAAGFSRVVVQWNAATYSQGHGHGQTILYVALRSIGDPLPVFADAARIYDAPGPLTIATLSVELNTRVHVWAKWESVDGVKSIDPAGGINGVTVTTSVDVTGLLEILTNEITESQLYAALGARIDLVDGNAAGSVNARILDEANTRAAAILAEAAARGAAITAETTIRESADESLAAQISLLSAGTGEQFDPFKAWYFDTGVEAWTSFDGASVASALNGWLRVIPTAGTPQAIAVSPIGIGSVGSAYSKIKARIKKIGTPGTWSGTIRFYAPGGALLGDAAVALPTFDGDNIAQVTWDMGAAWEAAPIIDRIRVELALTSSPTDHYELDWVSIGRPSPGASVAALQNETSARITADNAEAASRTTLATQMRGGYTGTDVNALTTGLLYSERLARSTADTAITSSVTALTATVAGNLSTVNASITSEATTRANADTALSSSVSTLSSTVTANNATLTAAVATEASTRASVDGHQAATYNVRVQLTEGARTVAGGFGIMGTSGGTAGPTIDFGVLANKFWIGAPSGTTGVADVQPFLVQTTSFTENGITRPAGVYMNAAYINNLTAVYATIQSLIADQITASSISVTKLTAGALTVGAYIQSSNYVPNVSGFRIHGDGTAEFQTGIFRGAVYASSGTFSGTLSAAIGTFAGSLAAASGTFSGQLLAATGSFTGNLSAATGTFAGSLSAATGTFSGALSAATGTFAGNLSAATGTYSGVLTAAAINAVDTINIKDNAVTVPLNYTTAASLVGDGTDPNGLSNSSWQIAAAFNFSMPAAGKLIALWQSQQSYTGFTESLVEMRLNGNVIGATNSGGDYGRSLIVMGLGNCTVGGNTLVIYWKSTGFGRLNNGGGLQRIVVMGAQK